MIPRTLSASSLQVAQLCLDRWSHEYMDRAGQGNNSAAAIGTSVHGGLEEYVAAVYIRHEHDDLTRPQLKDLLITHYQMSYVKTFNSADMETPEYKDGYSLTMKWFQRTDLSDRQVLSVEKKESLPIPYNHPDGATHKCERCVDQAPGVCVVGFTYIIDRLDQTGEDEYEVVDYKTVRVPIQPEDLEVKVQARAYALAVQVKYPNAKLIKVTFDLVRHERVSIYVTREENIAFWRYLCSETQRIVDTPRSSVRPTLNGECGYCVKKTTCSLLQSNIAAGGINSLSLEEKVSLLNETKNKAKAMKIIQEELEDSILRYASDTDTLEWESEAGDMAVEIGVSRGRRFNFQHAAQIMGPDLVAQVGKMNLGELDKLIADESLSKEMRDKLKALVHWENGNLTVKLKPIKKLI